MSEYIIDSIKPPMDLTAVDRPWWMGEVYGNFTVKSAYNVLRGRKQNKEWVRSVLCNGLPIKIVFFLWKVWKGRIATDDKLKMMKIQVVSRCYCCDVKEMETIEHLFLTALIAQKLWKQFVSFAGIHI